MCKLTVPGASLLMTGSPHTSMPYAMHHFKPRPPGRGFFYAQDVRYVAGAGRRRSDAPLSVLHGRYTHLPANPPSNPDSSVLTDSRDAGTFPPGRASSPSLGRSVADFLSAHGPRGKVPASRLGFYGFLKNSLRDQCHPLDRFLLAWVLLILLRGAGLFFKFQSGIWIIKHIHVKLTLAFRHDGRDHGITGDIYHGTGHVKQAIHTQYQGNTFCR